MGNVVDPNACAIFDTDEEGLEKIKKQLLDINNLAIDSAPEDLTINTHVCRGNFIQLTQAQELMTVY